MSKPLPIPEYISLYQLSYIDCGVICHVIPPGPDTLGMYKSRLDAEHALVIQQLTYPTRRYFVHELEFPTSILKP